MSGQPLRGFTDAYGNGNSGSKRDTNCHCDGNAHSYAHANSDSNADAYSNRGETVANAEAASIVTAAAPLVVRQLIPTA